jgi:membrane carboxypeptidase/penicillin-binding protein PbpC
MTDLQELKEQYKALNPKGKFPPLKMKEQDIIEKIMQWQEQPAENTEEVIVEAAEAKASSSVFIKNVFHKGIYYKSGDPADFDAETMEHFKRNEFIN